MNYTSTSSNYDSLGGYTIKLDKDPNIAHQTIYEKVYKEDWTFYGVKMMNIC